MKKVFFTVIILLVLGVTWKLYLEYENRRFIESLPPPPANVTQSADAPNTLVMEESPENHENIDTSMAENEFALLIHSQSMRISIGIRIQTLPIIEKHQKCCLSLKRSLMRDLNI